MRMRAFFLSLVVLVGLVGCKKNPLKPYGPQAQAKVAAIKNLAGKPLPLLSSDTLAFDGPLIESNVYDGDMAVFPKEDIASIGTFSVSFSLIHSESGIDRTAQWVNDNAVPSYISYEAAEHSLQNLLHLDKVFILKTIKRVDPVRTEGEFTPGIYQGEAHLFDMAGKYYGGVRFEATNSDEVKFTQHLNRDGKVERDDAGSSLEEDLRIRAWQAFTAAVMKRVPNAKFQLTP